MNEIALIDELLTRVNALPFDDWDSLDALRRRTEMVIRNVFGGDSRYIQDLLDISFTPIVFIGGRDIEADRRLWESSRQQFANLLLTMIEERQIFGGSPEGSINRVEERPPSSAGDEVFIVHGHDDAMKLSVARALEKLNLTAVILHERPNQGRTIIEKFTDYTDVNFAVVLLSPDDVAYNRSDDPKQTKTRARQNVVFELGYFIGKLGRANVMALFHPDQNFEMPSDYSGVLFIPYDKSGRWQFDLVRELKACGYDVDANKLLS